MRGVNKVILIGNLGADPDVKTTAGGTVITTLSVATSESWKDKQSGEQQERTEWHRVKLFGRLAEIAGEYLAKGRPVYIEGSIRTDKYTDKDGVQRYATDIIASELQMLGSGDGKSGGGSSTNQSNQRSNDRPAQNGNNRRDERTSQQPQRQAQPAHAGRESFEDDDIPF